MRACAAYMMEDLGSYSTCVVRWYGGVCTTGIHLPLITMSRSSTSPSKLAWQLDGLPCHTGDSFLQTLAVIRESRRDLKVAFASERASSFCHPLHVALRHHGAAM
eukprot:COSAG02_NODE_2924_length_7735_cov_4.298324_12_plen_105_part_00